MKNRIHLKAPGGWMNDPNGFIYYKGMYHLFYQYFPYAPRWGTMHWGHAVSRDLVDWEHLGVAIFPTRYEDRNGCFSGSAAEHDGRMYLYYTGVRYVKQNPLDIHECIGDHYESSQLMITSEDGIRFDNFQEKRTIIPVLKDGNIGDRTHTRDPKVWAGKDAWYMVLGSKTGDGSGKLLFYKSENLTDWRFINGTDKKENLGEMWECPDYFEVDGQQLLIFSPMGLPGRYGRKENHTVCMQVDFDEETCTMKIPEHYQFLDYGSDLYAAQSTVDAEGRRVLAAWLRMPEAVDGRWCGMFCIPRVVEVKEGHICFRVHPNVEKAYARRISGPEEADGAGYRVSLDIEEGETLDIGGYRISRREGRICTDRTAVCGTHKEQKMQCATPKVRDGFHLDVYVDPNMIEVFVNNGEYVITNAVYGLTNEMFTSCRNRILMSTLE